MTREGKTIASLSFTTGNSLSSVIPHIRADSLTFYTQTWHHLPFGSNPTLTPTFQRCSSSSLHFWRRIDETTHIHTHTPPHTHPHIGYTHTHKPTPCVCSTRSSCLLLSSVNTLSPGPLKCPPHSPSFPFSLTHSHYLSFLTSQQDPALRELLGGGRLAVSSVY